MIVVLRNAGRDIYFYFNRLKENTILVETDFKLKLMKIALTRCITKQLAFAAHLKKFVPVILIQLLSTAGFSQDKDSVVMLPEVVITAEWMINEQVDRSFALKFPQSYDIVWRKLNKDYLIKFIEVDLKHQSLFRKNGSLVYDIIYVNEAHLPRKIIDLFNNAYGDFNITNGARIERAGQEFWIVNLEGIRSYVVARIDDDEISEVKKIRKQ